MTETFESGTECSCLRFMQESLPNHKHVEHLVGCLVKGAQFGHHFDEDSHVAMALGEDETWRL
jgi:hypothetical protein